MRNRRLVPFFTALLLIVIVVIMQSVYVVTESQQVIVLQFGEPVRTVKEPGLYFRLPFVQDALVFERRVLMADSTAAEYLTLDKKRLLVDHISRWRIADPLIFYQTVGTETGALARLEQIIGSKLRQEIARHEFLTVIREQREQIMDTVTQESKELASAFGIDVLDVRIKRLDLPPEVQESVFSRMEAERRRISLRYQAEGEEAAREIRADADKQREVILAAAIEQAQRIRGEGDAMAARIYAEAFGQDPEFYRFLRRMEAYEQMVTEDTTLVLDGDSDLLRYIGSATGEGSR